MFSNRVMTTLRLPRVLPVTASTEGRKTCGILFLRRDARAPAETVMTNEMNGVMNMDNVAINNMSNKQLVEKLDNLVNSEHLSLIAVLEHLAIIEERKVYLADGYPSMFAYLQKRYNYTESSTCRRITASRLMREFPLVRTYLKSRAINLGTLSLLAKNLTRENCRD